MKQKTLLIKSLFFLLSSTIMLASCDHRQSNSKKTIPPATVIAQATVSESHLYYSGTIQPLVTEAALSPVDGRITEVLFKYGDLIKKGQTLAIIDSAQLSDDFHQAINGYLEKKDSVSQQETKFRGTENLWKAQVIPRNDYLSAKSELETGRLEFLQAKYQLEKVLAKAEIDPAAIEKLDISQTAKINALLKQKFSHIEVKAPAAGVALFPLPSQGNSGGSDSSDETIAVGNEVKTGQLILSIGDLYGYSTNIQISEIDINRIHANMPVIVTGDAFPGITLKGHIQSVASQAKTDSSSSSGIGMFDAIVAIPNIAKAAHNVIHVGMTCKIDIAIKNPANIMLPIQAVWKKDGQYYVTIVDQKTQQRLAKPVVTGSTTLTDIAIISGIQPGDKVLIHHD